MYFAMNVTVFNFSVIYTCSDGMYVCMSDSLACFFLSTVVRYVLCLLKIVFFHSLHTSVVTT